MDLAGKYLVVWLSPEAIETFLGVLEPSQGHAMTTWTVAGPAVVSRPVGEDLIYFPTDLLGGSL